MKMTSPIFAVLLLVISAPVESAPTAGTTPKKRVPRVWQPATKAQRVAVAASIRSQLEAFKGNNWTKAATYQSESLRRNFGTVAKFRSVIQSKYPQFARYKSVAFDDARALGDIVQIKVRLTGRDGVKMRAIYTMRKEKGLYRVLGVDSAGVPGQAQSPGDYI